MCALQVLSAWRALSVKIKHMGEIKKWRMRAEEGDAGCASSPLQGSAALLLLRTFHAWASDANHAGMQDLTRLLQQLELKSHMNAINAATCQLSHHSYVLATVVYMLNH